MLQNEESRKRVATGDALKVTSVNTKGIPDTGERTLPKKPRRDVEKSVMDDGEIKVSTDPFIDAENKEIARLEKLMGIKGGKHQMTIYADLRTFSCIEHALNALQEKAVAN